MKFCLIGEKLSHSYSKEIHNYLGLDYTLEEVKKEDLESFIKTSDYDGFNVTIPYKRDVIPFLDDIDELAKSVGAVNTIVKRNGKFIGYNTDVYGMKYMISKIGVSLEDKKVMILGSGGTSKTAKALCEFEKAKEIYVVSRTGEINYENCYELFPDVIINTTPVGMYPNNGVKVIDISKFSGLKGVVDCIYNPLKTPIIFDAERHNINSISGLNMLVAQGVKSEELWLDKKIDDCKIEECYLNLIKSKRNIVLIGMPSCGKTSIGKLLAEKLGREFIDSDDEIVKRAKKSIPEIFKEQGEEEFRKLESEVIKDIGKFCSKVIATGGGSPLREENRINLKQNGLIVYIKRDLTSLSSSGRPLSQSVGVEELFKKRKPIYESFSDVEVENEEIEKTVLEIMKI